jgi:hypothetical protein
MVYGIIVGNSPVRFTDPRGLFVAYGGAGGAYYLQDVGNVTVSSGQIIYSGEAGFNSGNNFNTTGSNYQQDTTNGFGAGYGVTAGFYTGPSCGFQGSSNNLTFDLGPFGFTYSENDAGWGLSFSFGGQGIGMGTYINTTNTTIYNQNGHRVGNCSARRCRVAQQSLMTMTRWGEELRRR